MPKIETVRLGCQETESQRAFYRTVLGMNEAADGTLGYGRLEARLSFELAQEPYQPDSLDLYWKITIAVPNIELACRQLTDRGMTIPAPRQFLDVGYLTHLTDPAGFTVELIEHRFQGDRQAEAEDPHQLGGGAHLNLLTLRTTNIDQATETCMAWHMKPLCIAPVPEHGFTLYFFAHTDEEPPSPELHAVGNRPWLYQRPYTVLELQHLHDKSKVVRSKRACDAGYLGTQISGPSDAPEPNDLRLRSAHPR